MASQTKPTKCELITASCGGFFFCWMALSCPYGQQRLYNIHLQSLDEFEERWNTTSNFNVCLLWCALIWLSFPFFIFFNIKLLQIYKIMNVSFTVYEIIRSLFNVIMVVLVLIPVPVLTGKVFNWDIIDDIDDTDNNIVPILQLLLARIQIIMFDSIVISMSIICILHFYVIISNKFLWFIVSLVLICCGMIEMFSWSNDYDSFWSKSGYSQYFGVAVVVAFGLFIPLWLLIKSCNLDSLYDEHVQQNEENDV